MAVIYLCPADKRLLCSWEGYASDIKQHFEKEHNALLFHTNSVDIDLNILHENRLLYLESEIYLLQTYIQNNYLYLRLRYLGSNQSAGKIQYDIAITVDNISYTYEVGRKFSCVIPRPQEWEIDLQQLEDFHGKLQSLTCTILLKNNIVLEPARKFSDVSLNINNVFVEENHCDDTELKIMQDLEILDKKIKELEINQNLEDLPSPAEERKKDSGDIMDRISLINFEMLEKPFSEANLACTSCTLDMLPPIYLCLEGHNICSRCRNNPCKSCNSIVTENRNRDLENISRTQKHLCRYHSDGCNEKLMYNEVRAHEARCQFCKYKCSNECQFEGRFTNFLNHLKIVHSSVRISHATHFEFPKNTEIYVANNAIGIFHCTSRQSHDFIRWTAVFCGPKERQFFCEIEFKGSKYKDGIFLKRRENVYEIEKLIVDMKKMKAKEKNAFLTITTYDN